jgi:hypothetical protein
VVYSAIKESAVRHRWDCKTIDRRVFRHSGTVIMSEVTADV